jgi:hypothetical protein
MRASVSGGKGPGVVDPTAGQAPQTSVHDDRNPHRCTDTDVTDAFGDRTGNVLVVVYSQIVLSFGIPSALIPLLRRAGKGSMW